MINQFICRIINIYSIVIELALAALLSVDDTDMPDQRILALKMNVIPWMIVAPSVRKCHLIAIKSLAAVIVMVIQYRGHVALHTTSTGNIVSIFDAAIIRIAPLMVSAFLMAST